MYSNIFVAYLLFNITNILGCWQLTESATFNFNINGEHIFASKEISNIPPIVSFLYNGKGVVEYCNGKTISLDWQFNTDNTISITYDNVSKDLFNIEIINDCLILKEITTNVSKKEYVLRHTDLIIEEFERTNMIITDNEYNSLIKENPFTYLPSFIVEGCEKDKNTLQIGGQEYLEIINGYPNTQCVVFIKSSDCQRNFPCYLVTRRSDKNGVIPIANYIKHVKIDSYER